MQLCTVANLKSYLGISVATHDTLLGLLVDGVSAFIELETGRTFGEAEFIETFDGNSTEFVIKNRPIKVATGVDLEYNNGTQATPSWVAVAVDDYVVDYETGIVTCTYGRLPAGKQNVRVTYTGGYATAAPAALELIAKELASKAFNQRKAQGISRESLGGASIDWRQELTDEQKMVIERYKNIVI